MCNSYVYLAIDFDQFLPMAGVDLRSTEDAKVDPETVYSLVSFQQTTAE